MNLAFDDSICRQYVQCLVFILCTAPVSVFFSDQLSLSDAVTLNDGVIACSMDSDGSVLRLGTL